MSDKGKFGSEAGFRDGRVVSVVTLPQALSASLLCQPWRRPGPQAGGRHRAGPDTQGLQRARTPPSAAGTPPSPAACHIAVSELADDEVALPRQDH